MTLSLKPKDKKPVNDYLRLQGRFRHLNEEQIAAVQAEVDAKWERLLKGCGAA
jgi:pyruvate/2-oxoacid:ferredoxin oxidoreductase beta subunit